MSNAHRRRYRAFSTTSGSIEDLISRSRPKPSGPGGGTFVHTRVGAARLATKCRLVKHAFEARIAIGQIIQHKRRIPKTGPTEVHADAFGVRVQNFVVNKDGSYPVVAGQR